MDYIDHTGLWQNELNSWVPQEIFDAHVHLGPGDILKTTISHERSKAALSTFLHLEYDEYTENISKLFPGRNLAGIFAFPFPLREIEYAPANQYIIDLMKDNRNVNGFVWLDPTQPEELAKQFVIAEKKGVRFCGVKPYFDTLGKSNFDVSMEDLLSKKSLSFMNQEKLMLMLHTAGFGIVDKKVRDFIRMITDRFPNITIILAHAGRFVNPSEYNNFIESDLPERPQIYLDFSSVTVTSVLYSLLSIEALHDKILFATDIPFGLISGIEQWSDTGGALFRTRDKYSWSEPGLHGHKDLTWNVYHVLEALKDAVKKLKLNSSEENKLKQKIFHTNALKLLGKNLKRGL